MLFQAKLFKGVLPEPGEGTQMPTKNQAGTHRWASSNLPPCQGASGDHASAQAEAGRLVLQNTQLREPIRIRDSQPGIQAMKTDTGLGQAKTVGFG